MAGVRRYEDLEVWQIADELKREVYALTATGSASNDVEYRSQIRASAASSTKNIAEGFGRFRPADNARFVEFAVSSTMETKDSLKDGIDRGHFTPERALRARQLAERSIQLAERSIQCSTKFIVYLKSCKKKHRPRTSND